MKCLAIRHVRFEDLGLFGPVLARRGFQIDYVEAGVMPLPTSAWERADLVVVLGGPIGVGDRATYSWLDDEIAAIRQRLQSGRPLLSICLGAQLMAAALGAGVDIVRLRLASAAQVRRQGNAAAALLNRWLDELPGLAAP